MKRIRVEPDARVLAGLVLAPPSGMTVAALAAHTPRGEAYVAIHCKTAWQADPPLVERTMREDAWAYVLTDEGRAYVYDRVTFPERTDTAPELPAPAAPALPEVVPDPHVSGSDQYGLAEPTFDVEPPTHLPEPLRALREAWDDGRMRVEGAEVYVGIDMATEVAGATFFLVRPDGGIERIPEDRIHVLDANDPRRCPLCGGRDLYYAWTPMRQPCTTCERTVELLPDRLALPAGVPFPA